jgi:selenocysteine-specific elongation factor
VGVLGHADSGKTSLMRALSQVLSTAALDKHPQSKARGITLDLAFSAFSVPMPAHVLAELERQQQPPQQPPPQQRPSELQFTLVDRPGRA